MENEKDNKVYVHYTHTHPSKFSRWTARESFQFMYKRPWQQVLDFYSNVVTGRCSLSELLGIKGYKRVSWENIGGIDGKKNPTKLLEIDLDEYDLSPQTHRIYDDGEIVEASDETEFSNVLTKDRGGRWERLTFKIVLSYHGASFDGWQKQPGLNTVQGFIEASLGTFVDEKKAEQLKEKCLPVEGIAVVAGRTDKGVTALQQVCSFYTWKKDVKVQDIEDAINGAAPGKLRVISVSEVSRVFHPNFSAQWRRYFYIFPLNDWEDGDQNSKSEMDAQKISFDEKYGEDCSDNDAEFNGGKNSDKLIFDDDAEFRSEKKPTTFSISRVDQLLRQLEGKLLSYKIFARDTKASRNIGPPTECFVFHARATEARLQNANDGQGTKVMCIELVSNRFLRKMVRVLVATSIREAAAGAEENALLKLMDATCRRATAPPAPPDGLCLVDVGYTEFDPQNCFIR